MIRRRCMGIMEYHKDADDDASDNESSIVVDVAWSRPIWGVVDSVPRHFPGRIHWRLALTIKGDISFLSCLVFSEPLSGDVSIASQKEPFVEEMDREEKRTTLLTQSTLKHPKSLYLHLRWKAKRL